MIQAGTTMGAWGPLGWRSIPHPMRRVSGFLTVNELKEGLAKLQAWRFHSLDRGWLRSPAPVASPARLSRCFNMFQTHVQPSIHLVVQDFATVRSMST